MPSERVVWGIPGSGKTNFGTKLSKIWLGRGVKNDEIAYLAFTKAAAKAAAKKILDSEDDMRLSEAFPYFRTIHSLSYMGLRKSKAGVRMITPGHMKAFSKASGMDGAYTLYEWEDDMGEVFQKANKGGKTDWDNALAAYTMSRLSAGSRAELEIARIQPSQRACSLLGVENMRCDLYQTFVSQYERFKLAEEVIDFTDMLEYALFEMDPLDCRFFIIDEAQDLCPLHYAIITKLASNAEEIFWIGDDDQSIYQWSGASANLFLDRAKQARYHIQLRQTHRYGQDIVDFSGRIISRVSRRHPKEILGVQGLSGRVIHSGEFKPVTGDVLIMNRHVHGCQAIADAYIAAGLPFINERGKDPLNVFSRVSAWETLNTLAKGGTVGMSHAASMIEELMKSLVPGDHGEKVRLVVHGAKAKFENFPNEQVGLYDLVKANVLTQEGMNVISEREYWTLKHSLDLEYYDRVVKNGYSLDADPEHIPKITTIHGSKGREAEQAIVFSEMSNRCWDDPDSEHRLAYVAATRTQSDLTVCAENTVEWARSQYHYPFLDTGKEE